MKERWLRKEYFGFVRAVLEAQPGSSTESSKVFEPQVNPASLDTLEAREKALKLLKRVLPHHHAAIASRVNAEYLVFTSTLDPALLHSMET